MKYLEFTAAYQCWISSFTFHQTALNPNQTTPIQLTYHIHGISISLPTYISGSNKGTLRVCVRRDIKMCYTHITFYLDSEGVTLHVHLLLLHVYGLPSWSKVIAKTHGPRLNTNPFSMYMNYHYHNKTVVSLIFIIGIQIIVRRDFYIKTVFILPLWLMGIPTLLLDRSSSSFVRIYVLSVNFLD